jgi:hypothetical protein
MGLRPKMALPAVTRTAAPVAAVVAVAKASEPIRFMDASRGVGSGSTSLVID